MPDDGFTIEQVGHRLAVLVDIADAAASGDAEYEKPAVTDFKGAVKAFGNFSDFVVVGGLCLSFG